MINISPVKTWRNQKKTIEILGNFGTVISFTVIRVPPLGFENQAPYPVVIAKLGKRLVVGQLVGSDAKNIKIGMKVKTVLRRIKDPGKEGIIPYGVKFKPL